MLPFHYKPTNTQGSVSFLLLLGEFYHSVFQLTDISLSPLFCCRAQQLMCLFITIKFSYSEFSSSPHDMCFLAEPFRFVVNHFYDRCLSSSSVPVSSILPCLVPFHSVWHPPSLLKHLHFVCCQILYHISTIQSQQGKTGWGFSAFLMPVANSILCHLLCSHWLDVGLLMTAG